MKPSASVLLRLAVPSDLKYLSVVHERAREVAESNRFGALESEQWALAVEECAANSIEHAYGGRPDGEVDITLALEGTTSAPRSAMRAPPSSRACISRPTSKTSRRREPGAAWA